MTSSCSKATVVFLNNYCFPQHLEQSVLKKFKAGLKNGVRIITLKYASLLCAVCPHHHPVTVMMAGNLTIFC